MTNRDLLLRNRQRQAQKADVKPRYRAVLCAANGSRDAGSVWANENAKLVYFQFFGSGGVGIARCEKIVPELGLGVYVGKTDDNLAWQVLEDDPLLRRTSTNNRNYQSVAARDLKPGGRLFLWVDSRQIDPLATYPTPTTLNVNVAPGDYPYSGTRKTFTGALDYDLSASVPGASLHRYVGLYLDSANTLQTVNGTTTSTANDPPEPTWPAGAFRLSVVRLRNGQTEIIFTLKNDSTNDIFDRRMMWSETGPLYNLTATTAPTVNDDSGDGYSVGSIWVDVTGDNVYMLVDSTVGAAVWEQLNGGGGGSTLTIKNTSGATANAKATGYINEAGEYKTTTTANADVTWCVVITGGANNADIEVAVSGVVAIDYAGSVPSAGHFLVTSTTAGKATRQATMRPEIFAVCLVSGVGSDGTVDRALLLCNTRFVPVTDANLVYGITGHSNTDFVATINGAPSATSVVYNAPSSGAEDVLVRWTSTLGLMTLHNTTRGTSRLISSVNTGTNTITTISTADAWASGDTITIRSQTNTAGGPAYYFDVDLSQQTVIPVLARAVVCEMQKVDTATGITFALHPFEANSGAKVSQVQTNAANINFFKGQIAMPLLNRKFVFMAGANGSATSTSGMYLFGYQLATP